MSCKVFKGQRVLGIVGMKMVHVGLTWLIDKGMATQEYIKAKKLRSIETCFPIQYEHAAGATLSFEGVLDKTQDRVAQETKMRADKIGSLGLPPLPPGLNSVCNKDRKCILPLEGFPKHRSKLAMWHAQLVQNSIAQNGGSNAEREREREHLPQRGI